MGWLMGTSEVDQNQNSSEKEDAKKGLSASSNTKPLREKLPDETHDETPTNRGSLSSIDTVGTDDRMKVLLRIRPLSKTEKLSKANLTPTVQANEDEKTLQVYNADGKISVMSFNRVYDESSSQTFFFDNSGVTDLLALALKGYVATIFAFGQTGSGKTFTITGPTDVAPDPDTVGIVPRALEHLFSLVKKDTESNEISSIRIQASYMEIYNENVLDLLNPQNSGLPVRWSAERGFFVEHLFIVDCDSLDDCLAVLEEGSEKVKESRTTLDTFAEALSINKSLLTLGKCISALADPKKRGGHIPFRDSKLTKMLADSLSGKGLALMIACISPAFQNLNETLKTVRYAMQARKIQNRPVIQLDPQEEMVLNFKTEIAFLRKENNRLKGLLKNDPKYQDMLKQMADEEEPLRRSKSRPPSPSQRQARPIGYRDRIESSIPSLPDIRARNYSVKPVGQKTPLPRHSRRSTTNPPFSTTASPRKSLTNALPVRLTNPSQRKLQPKSAATQRIEEMKKSTAPAGHEMADRAERGRASLSRNERRKSTDDRRVSRDRGTSVKPDRNRDKGKAAGATGKSTGVSRQSTRTITKRPSAIESIPHIVKEPFPEPGPAGGHSKKHSTPKPKPALPTHDEHAGSGAKLAPNKSTKHQPSVQEIVHSRHATLKEVEALDHEIKRLKKAA
ncbi:Kinesin- protein 12 [Kappamyces sp. JEL0680]|nr:Kinesin- protein 12 [Kappamyces sp. JEL0680]